MGIRRSSRRKIMKMYKRKELLGGSKAVGRGNKIIRRATMKSYLNKIKKRRFDKRKCEQKEWGKQKGAEDREREKGEVGLRKRI